LHISKRGGNVMGLFFSRRVAPTAREALRNAYIANAITEPEAHLHSRHIALQFPGYARALTDAYIADPVPLETAERQATHIGNELAKASGAPTAQVFNSTAFWGSVALLVLIFAAGIYAQHDDQMKDWASALLHTFQLLLGGWVGILVGEKSSS
jgi:hypothetical protein